VKSRTVDFEKTDVELNCKTYKSNDGYGEIELYFFIEKYRMNLSLYWSAIILIILAFIIIFIMCWIIFNKCLFSGCEMIE
jgi:predicted RND superfamily exporter protein